MIRKKVCMLGAFSVGKTSLIKRYVKSIFSEKYHTTIGVKIEKKEIELNGELVQLMIWDLAGEDDFTDLNMSYLRGASGYIVVVDPTRPDTFRVAMGVLERARSMSDWVPAVIALNKCDLKDDWQIDETHLSSLTDLGCDMTETSAKSGDGVEMVFSNLAGKMLER